jgi:hypothetical protein
MYRAKTLLRDTDLSLRQIAVRVGYRSNAALNRVFTRREASPRAVGDGRRGHDKNNHDLRGRTMDRRPPNLVEGLRTTASAITCGGA